MDKKVSAIIGAIISVLIGIQLVTNHAEKTALEITTSGDDRVVIAAVVYEPGEGLGVDTISCDGAALTKTAASGSLSGVREIELWYGINPDVGDLPVTITMTEDCVAEVSLISLKDVDQDIPFADQLVSIGQDVSDASINADGGDATVVIVFSSPASKTLSTPAGFVELEDRTGASDIRITAFIDEDASETTATLAFSGAVDFTAYTLGVNLAE